MFIFAILTNTIITMTVNISKKQLIIGGSIIALIILALIGYHFYSISQYEKNAKEFKAGVSALQLPMAYVLDDYQNNWRSAIYDDRAINEDGFSTYCGDFSTAIRWRMNANKEIVGVINSHFVSLKLLMEKMKNPPGKYEKVHEKLLNIYNNMYKLNSLCESPDGSLQSFSNDVNLLFSEIKTEMNETDITIENDADVLKQKMDRFTVELEAIRDAKVASKSK